jgi:hypothetical protein
VESNLLERSLRTSIGIIRGVANYCWRLVHRGIAMLHRVTIDTPEPPNEYVETLLMRRGKTRSVRDDLDRAIESWIDEDGPDRGCGRDR